MTPPLRARGVWTVRAPFTVSEKVDYTCIAIRTLPDLYNDGVDPLLFVYDPVQIVEGLEIDGTKFSLKNEELKGINIISLQAPNGVVIHIPDNFILSYPDSTAISYEHVVITCSLGVLPNGLDTSEAERAVADAVKNAFGVTANVNIARAPSQQALTYEEHLALERARKAAIKIDKTSAQQIEDLNAKVNLQQETIKTLTQILIDNNIMPG